MAKRNLIKIMLKTLPWQRFEAAIAAAMRVPRGTLLLAENHPLRGLNDGWPSL